MESPYRRELELAIGAAQTAAHISRVALSAAAAARTEQEDGGGTSAAPSAPSSSSHDDGTFDVVKDDLSPVTVADFAIQAVLARTLGNAFPGDGFVGEESADELRRNPRLLTRVLDIVAQCAGPSLFRDAEDLCDLIDSCTTTTTSSSSSPARTWVFDPIDGTKTFIRGEQYAINIALLEAGRQVLSVVACPLLSADATTPVTDATVDPTGRGCILFAVRGHGAYVRPLLLPGGDDNAGEDKQQQQPPQPRRLPRHAEHVASAEDLRFVTSWTLLDSGVDAVHKAVAERLRVPFPGCDLLGWVPRWAVLALGVANTTVWVYKRRDRRAKIWDHAGAMLLFEEVGGVITDVHGKEIDLTAGRKLEANFGFVAAPRNLHQTVLETVAETLKAHGKHELLV